jgi:hypothetical protein
MRFKRTTSKSLTVWIDFFLFVELMVYSSGKMKLVDELGSKPAPIGDPALLGGYIAPTHKPTKQPTRATPTPKPTHKPKSKPKKKKQPVEEEGLSTQYKIGALSLAIFGILSVSKYFPIEVKIQC